MTDQSVRGVRVAILGLHIALGVSTGCTSDRPSDILTAREPLALDGRVAIDDVAPIGEVTHAEWREGAPLYVIDATSSVMYAIDSVPPRVVSTIDRRGRGPGELQSPSTILVLAQGRIALGDGSRLSFFRTDLQFEGSVDLPGQIVGLSEVGDSVYATVSGQPRQSVVTRAIVIGMPPRIAAVRQTAIAPLTCTFCNTATTSDGDLYLSPSDTVLRLLFAQVDSSAMEIATDSSSVVYLSSREQDSVAAIRNRVLELVAARGSSRSELSEISQTLSRDRAAKAAVLSRGVFTTHRGAYIVRNVNDGAATWIQCYSEAGRLMGEYTTGRSGRVINMRFPFAVVVETDASGRRHIARYRLIIGC